jgi:glycosyltransferase involved in cell wall biosynthesis
MRIAHLIAAGQLGGAEASLLEIVESLRDARPDWSFLVVTPEHGPLEGHLQSLRFPVEILPFPRGLARLGEAGQENGIGGRVALAASLLRAAPGVWTYQRRLRALLGRTSRDAPDLVHAHGFKMHALGAWSLPPGAALVWHLHDYISPRPISARLVRLLASRCRMLVANSSSVAEDARRVCGPSARITTIYNAVDLRRFMPAGPALDLDRLGAAALPPRGTVRVGLLATFGRWKGHRTFLGALARLPRELPIRGYVIGGPVYQTAGSQVTESELRRVAADLGIADRVVFTGPVRDAAGALRALDVVVHASTQPEPFGMVIAEGMACGRPVIVSLGGGAAELIEVDVDGLGYPPGDEVKLGVSIARLARDAGLRQRLASRARASAERRFDRARLAEELIPIYQNGRAC